MITFVGVVVKQSKLEVSFHHFCKALRQYSQENNVLFTIVDSKTIEAANKASKHQLDIS